MKHDVLFIQGGGADTYDQWDNKLVASLQRELGDDYAVHYPRMPNESDPSYARWKPAIEKEIAKLDDGLILVGHSIGATVLINALVDMPKRILGGIFLISAPFIGDGGWPSDEIDPPKDLGARLPAGVPVFLYHGDTDDTAPVAHVDLYAKAIPQAVVRRLKGRDHQLNDDMREPARDIRSTAQG